MLDERIEAKLAAYIDGVLPPAERLEIEQHLADNPRHAAMIRQMLHAKQWLGTLPRVQAPPDLMDTLDPMLERAALLTEEPVQTIPWTARWLSPQVLALAATLALVVTLLASMIFLTPGGEGDPSIALVEEQPTEEPSSTSPPPAQARPRSIIRQELDPPNRPDQLPAQSDGTGIDVPPGVEEAIPLDGGNQAPDGLPIPELFETEDAPAQPVQPQPNVRVPRDSLLVSAEVENIPDASGRVAHFLATNDLAHAGRRMPVSELPPAIRDQLELPAEQRVMVYVVDEINLAKVGELTAELSRAGTSRVVTPRWERARRVEEPRGDKKVDRVEVELMPDLGKIRREQLLREQARLIYHNDILSVGITRRDSPDEPPRPGVPDIPSSMKLDIQVSPDGYADLSELGLGRIDVLGREPGYLSSYIQERLSHDYLIPSSVQAIISKRSEPQEGRRSEAVQLVNLERQPLKPGDLLQIDYADGTWMQAVIEEDGKLHAGPLGVVSAAGQSSMALQSTLRQIEAGLDQDSEGEPLRLVNLTARRTLNLDRQADQTVPLVIVLDGEAIDDAPVPAHDPWQDLD